MPEVESRRARRLSWAVAVALGVFVGLGLFTVEYGEGASYLSDSPEACINCHVMQPHYTAWLQSSHSRAAACNDCHLRHDFVGKWVTKADNGFFHSVAFTTGDFPDPIRIKPRNRIVTQEACLHCHAEFVPALLPPEPQGEVPLCVSCHAAVGHAGR